MKTPVIDAIPAELMNRPAEGVNLRPGTLGDNLGERPTLLVLLRHFGCIFCRETVNDLRAATEADPAYPPVLFVYQESPELGQPFFDEFWPAARAVSDPERALYRALGVERMGLKEMFHPGVIACGLRAASKGNAQTKATADPMQMPGVFLVQGERILWQHDYAHGGDSPDWENLPARLRMEAVAHAEQLEPQPA
jgi:hypothetical protein